MCACGVGGRAGHRGGTLVRHGVAVRRYTALDPPLDEGRLRALLNDAFGKQLVAHYFDDIRSKDRYWIYLAGDYQGGVVALASARGRRRTEIDA